MKSAVVTAICVMCSTFISRADIWVVDQGGGGNFQTIQEAIDFATTGDEIIVNPGTYVENLDYIGKDLHIHSASGPDVTTIDGSEGAPEQSSCVVFRSGESISAILEGFTLTGGRGTHFSGYTRGGAVFCLGSVFTLRDCRVINNHAFNAGGIQIMNDAGALLIDSEFEYNICQQYGGAVAASSGFLYIEGCVFESNFSALAVGGVSFAQDIYGEVDNCIFRFNRSPWVGAMTLGQPTSKVVVRNCLFEGNEALSTDGGGIRVWQGSLVAEDCVFVGNLAGGRGGGLMAYDGADVQATGCTFYGNQALWGGGNLYLDGGSYDVSNCIIARAESGGGLNCPGGTIQVTCCDAWDNNGGNYVGMVDPTGQFGNISLDPLFCDPEAGDFTLHVDSPCVPFSPPNPECDLIGACPVGCGIIIVVTPDGTGDYPTIQAAIDACADGYTIELTDGTFTGDGNRDIDYLGKEITVRSASGACRLCIIDCEGSLSEPHRGFVFQSGEDPGATLEGVVIRNGFAELGGAVLCAGGAAPTLSGCILTRNTGIAEGGGVYCEDAALTFISCTLSGNSAPDGGGISSRRSTLVLHNTIIAFSDSGRAISCHGSTNATLACCDLYGNQGGDWMPPIIQQLGINGNFSADPCFCDACNNDYHLWNYSPCAQEQCGLIGSCPIGCWHPQGGKEGPTDPGTVAGLILSRNSPNPFGALTRVSYTLPRSPGLSQVSLDVLDATGRSVRVLINAMQPPGRHGIAWDGTDQAGNPVASGAYFYQLRVGAKSLTQRMILVR